MITSLQNIVISGAHGLLNVDGIKIFDKDDQAAKHCSFCLNVWQPGHLYQKFWSYQHLIVENRTSYITDKTVSLLEFLWLVASGIFLQFKVITLIYFKLLWITATQKIAHHSVHFIPIWNFFKTVHSWLNSSVRKNFKAKASVLYLVGVIKICE